MSPTDEFPELKESSTNLNPAALKRLLFFPAALVAGSACILESAAAPTPTGEGIIVTPTAQAGDQESR